MNSLIRRLRLRLRLRLKIRLRLGFMLGVLLFVAGVQVLNKSLLKYMYQELFFHSTTVI